MTDSGHELPRVDLRVMTATCVVAIPVPSGKQTKPIIFFPSSPTVVVVTQSTIEVGERDRESTALDVNYRLMNQSRSQTVGNTQHMNTFVSIA